MGARLWVIGLEAEGSGEGWAALISPYHPQPRVYHPRFAVPVAVYVYLAELSRAIEGERS